LKSWNRGAGVDVHSFLKGDEVYVNGDYEPYGIVTSVGSKNIMVKKHKDNRIVAMNPKNLWVGKNIPSAKKGTTISGWKHKKKKYHKGGVTYQDLSKVKADVVNEPKPTASKIKEVEVVKTGLVNFEGTKKVNSSKDARDIFKEFWEETQVNIAEHFNVLLLGNANNAIGINQHSKGGINGTVADIEIISAMAVKSLAKGVVICHNHPSGNLRPSQADINLTKQLKEALKLFNIALLDSLIIDPDFNYYSLADEGMM
jgi:DNA repair protein RadC